MILSVRGMAHRNPRNGSNCTVLALYLPDIVNQYMLTCQCVLRYLGERNPKKRRRA